MSPLQIILRVLSLVVVCPVVIFCEAHGNVRGRVSISEGAHVHKSEVPCAVCPRQGRCVPKVQCPAHLRPASHNPACHLQGTKALGVCCFTGSHHAAESEHKVRKASSINERDVKTAHHQSKQKLASWLARAEGLAQHHAVVVNETSPSFAHHMSVMTYDKRADKLGRGGLLNLFAAQELKARQALSDDELALGFTEHTDGPFCPPPPTCSNPPSRYRSIGGDCNNPKNPSWGAVHSGYERLLPPDYSDGTWAMRASSTGLPLPSPRLVSNALILDAPHPSPTHNLMFMQFGQFIAHDTTSGVVFTIGNGSAISCCSGDGEQFLPPELQHWACAPIAAAPEDDFYGQFRHQCLNMVRTQLAPSSDCSVGYAKQMNGVTHFPDLSHIYGSSDERLAILRGSGGLLKTFNDYGRELPPLTERKECLTLKEGAACFESGDNHGNQIISLTVLHTLWTREHNRIARALARLNPMWDEERIFMEARRIAQAEFQNIIYSEWLPLLLGPQAVQAFGLLPSPGYSSLYDPHVNPALSAEFATAAMRFGHSVVDGKIMIPSTSTGTIYESISIPEVMFQPARMRLKPFFDRLIAGLSWQPMQSVDPFVTEGLTRYLFHGGNPFGLDLASINIQRGRDYGVRPYNAYRRLVGLEPIVDFNQFTPNTAQRLGSVYQSPDDIDLWVGGLLEEAVGGGVVGVTFSNILADQFSKIKRGDRYFYENGPDVNPGAFSPYQLAEIKKVTLARIICDNRDGIELLAQPPNAFIRADLPGNEPVPCDSSVIPAMDLSRFREI
ncbi:chorion peroxidase isoform X2 [Ostrinia furnacalis]|uniref:chorion peroxidase isoform X2 n=1 Tax=Ostrinia furnacalis TaxID=93504 RepID=UPI00103A944A|nr:chorion peroxidase isoform X2 [Ostrinia furnacalis]